MAEATKLKRPPFAKRQIRLIGRTQVDTAIAMLNSAPLDADRPLLLVLGEEPKGRKLDQNALMWAGPLADIAEQVWVEKRQFSIEVWHEYFKKEFLPDERRTHPLSLAEQVKDVEKYRKWDFAPDGERVLVGSTTQLTVAGFALYLHHVEEFGASRGVQFSAAPGQA